MKHLYLFVLSIILCSFASHAGGVKPDNYIVMKESGDTVPIFGEVSKDDFFVHYKDAGGKKASMAQAKITMMAAGGDIFFNLEIARHVNRLQKIIATNNKYILTEYDDKNGSFLYVWDKNFVNIESRLYCNSVTSTTGPTRYGKKLVNETLAKYFGSCKELIDMLNENLKTGFLTNGISNYQCTEME